VAITLAEPREHPLLKPIARDPRQNIVVEKIPRVADRRARRLALTRAALQESLVDDADDLEHFRVVVETLTDEFDLVDIALAAVKLAHESGGGVGDEDEIPDVTEERRPGRARDAKPSRGGARLQTGGVTRLFINAGRTAGVRPRDLVGAIANETSLSGRDIGAIEIADRFSLVEVPAGAANEVIAALKASSVKGKKVNVRRDRA
jgi:ATP-dependent RNA helicase DeaD